VCPPHFLHRYVHGHDCVGHKSKQPTYVLTSTDGVEWESPLSSSRNSENNKNTSTQENGLIFNDIFYLTAPIKLNDGWFYVIGKTQEDSVGSTILCRSRSLIGPFERGPLLARGMRHGDMHLIMENNTSKILIFYTLIGDAPERILLATLDMHDNNWESWRLFPGPTILTPTLEFEHGNSNVAIPSKAASEGCDAHAQFRDPSFLQDNSNDDDDCCHLTGTLFYTIQGERAFAASHLDIDLDALFGATHSRDHALIPEVIQHASSLAGNISYNKKGSSSLVVESPVLFTGNGRSGTDFLCHIFQASGLNISHDNDHDCGPYPGSDGKHISALLLDVPKEKDTNRKSIDRTALYIMITFSDSLF
jgi:hypothetical protein